MARSICQQVLELNSGNNLISLNVIPAKINGIEVPGLSQLADPFEPYYNEDEGDYDYNAVSDFLNDPLSGFNYNLANPRAAFVVTNFLMYGLSEALANDYIQFPKRYKHSNSGIHVDYPDIQTCQTAAALHGQPGFCYEVEAGLKSFYIQFIIGAGAGMFADISEMEIIGSCEPEPDSNTGVGTFQCERTPSQNSDGNLTRLDTDSGYWFNLEWDLDEHRLSGRYDAQGQWVTPSGSQPKLRITIDGPCLGPPNAIGLTEFYNTDSFELSEINAWGFYTDILDYQSNEPIDVFSLNYDNGYNYEPEYDNSVNYFSGLNDFNDVPYGFSGDNPVQIFRWFQNANLKYGYRFSPAGHHHSYCVGVDNETNRLILPDYNQQNVFVPTSQITYRFVDGFMTGNELLYNLEFLEQDASWPTLVNEFGDPDEGTITPAGIQSAIFYYMQNNYDYYTASGLTHCQHYERLWLGIDDGDGTTACPEEFFFDMDCNNADYVRSWCSDAYFAEGAASCISLDCYGYTNQYTGQYEGGFSSVEEVCNVLDVDGDCVEDGCWNVHCENYCAIEGNCLALLPQKPPAFQVTDQFVYAAFTLSDRTYDTLELFGGADAFNNIFYGPQYQELLGLEFAPAELFSFSPHHSIYNKNPDEFDDAIKIAAPEGLSITISYFDSEGDRIQDITTFNPADDGSPIGIFNMPNWGTNVSSYTYGIGVKFRINTNIYNGNPIWIKLGGKD